MSIGDNIKRLREQYNLTQDDIGKIAGVSYQAVSSWERGEREPRMGAIERLAEHFGIRKSDIIEDYQHHRPVDNLHPIKRRLIPVLGSIAAGKPIWADESHEEYVLDNGDVQCDFALKVKGDSMEPLLFDGDIVFVREQPDVLDGQIAVVLVDDSATLKVLYHIPDGIQLVSKNSAYAPMIHTGQRASTVRVLGLAVQFTRGLI